MIKTILTLFLLFLLTQTSNAATINEEILRHVICHKETRVSEIPAFAVSRNGADWGACQVKYWTATKYGKFSLTRSPGDLFIESINREVALNIIKSCIKWYPKGTIKRIAYCYNAGHSSTYGSRKRSMLYAEEIKQMYFSLLTLEREKDQTLFVILRYIRS